MYRLIAGFRTACLAGMAWAVLAIPVARGQMAPPGYVAYTPVSAAPNYSQPGYNPYSQGDWQRPGPSGPYGPSTVPLPPVQPIYGPATPPSAPQPNVPGCISNPQATMPGPYTQAQTYGYGRRSGMVPPSPSSCPAPLPFSPPAVPPCLPPAQPSCPTPAPITPPSTSAPSTTAPSTTAPSTEPSTTTPSTTPSEAEAPSPGAAGEQAAGNFGGEGGGALGGSNFTGVGYIDSAIPITQYRIRFDSAYDDNRPDRADFFYPKCGCFRGAPAPFTDRGAPGPGTVPAQSVNYQELYNSIEYAFNRRFSVWVDVPIRSLDINFVGNPPGGNDNHTGLSDMQFGFKYAMIYQPGRVVTFQLRTYAPTGNASLGLGRNNWNVEPALLYFQRLTPQLFLEAELRDFTPVYAGDDFAGNVLREGVGLSYLLYNSTNFRFAPVGELVGWEVLSGKESTTDGTVLKNAAGDTIVNAKFGVRVGFGRATQPGVLSRIDWYTGYGRALTGAVWYKDIIRTELRIRF